MNRIGRGLFWGLVALFGLVGTPALAQDPLPPPPAPPEAPNQGLAYLIISLDDEFGAETGTIVVPLGLFVGGETLDDTVFTPADAPFIPVQFLPGDVTFADLEGNATTIIGAFQEDNTGAAIHLINSAEDEVDPDVQEAIYNATRYDGEGPHFSDLFWHTGDPEDPDDPDMPLFPTTADIADFIADFGEVSADDVHDAIFGEPETLTEPDPGSPTVECEGELFPHDEESTLTFDYAFVVNETGAFNLELCDEIIEVEIDITPTSSSPNSINLKKKGLLAVAILSSDDFDATEVGAETVELGGVPAEKDSIDDVNDDGLDDLVLHFSVPALVEGGFLNEDTTRLTLVGELSEGVCIRGSDSVSVTANNKK